MSEAQHLAAALELLFTSEAPGWFSPIATATDDLTAAQASKVPRELQQRLGGPGTPHGLKPDGFWRLRTA